MATELAGEVERRLLGLVDQAWVGLVLEEHLRLKAAAEGFLSVGELSGGWDQDKAALAGSPLGSVRTARRGGEGCVRPTRCR